MVLRQVNARDVARPREVAAALGGSAVASLYFRRPPPADPAAAAPPDAARAPANERAGACPVADVRAPAAAAAVGAAPHFPSVGAAAERWPRPARWLPGSGRAGAEGGGLLPCGDADGPPEVCVGAHYVTDKGGRDEGRWGVHNLVVDGVGDDGRVSVLQIDSWGLHADALLSLAARGVVAWAGALDDSGLEHLGGDAGAAAAAAVAAAAAAGFAG
eukprot:gene2628-7877_t